MKKPFFSILIPTYNGQLFIIDTINSILSQDFADYEIVINDDNSKDNTIKTIRSIKDSRIHIFKNKTNQGYSKNLESCRQRASGEIVFLMGQDDILFPKTLSHYHQIFKSNKDIGAITRPYYWFDKNVKSPVRIKEKFATSKDKTITINDNYSSVVRVIDTLDQLSGLAYRKKFIDLPFHQDIFTCHIYPFLSIFKTHPIVFVGQYNLAVRIASSQTRFLSSIYDKSPIKSWRQMVDSILFEKKYKNIREYLIKNFIAKNYVGLVQIKNYAKTKYLYREIFYLINYRWQNIFAPSFWFFSLGCILTPSFILIPFVDWYKNNINYSKYKNIKI